MYFLQGDQSQQLGKFLHLLLRRVTRGGRCIFQVCRGFSGYVWFLLHQWPSSQTLNRSHDPGNFLLASRFTSYYQKLSINYIPTYLNGAEYGTFDDLMLPIGEGLKAMERLCSSAHWTNRRSLLTLPEGLSMGLFSFLSLRFGLTERSIFFSSTADVFVKAVSRFWSAVYALLVYWWPFLFPPFE